MSAVLLTGCGGGEGLVVGVRAGQPGLVQELPGGGWSGFDVAVAHYVARELGYRDDQIHYTYEAGDADLALLTTTGTYSAELAGPYLVTNMDVLVRASEPGVRTVKDLAARPVCGTSEAIAPLVAKFGPAWRAAYFAEANVPAACAPLLADRRVDAIVADAPVLAGIAAQYPDRMKVLGRALAPSRYGIRLSGKAADLRDDVQEALRQMFEDGSWRRAVIDNMGSFATRYSPPALESAK